MSSICSRARRTELNGLRVVVDTGNGAAAGGPRGRCGAWAPRSWRSTPARTATTSTTAAAPRTWPTCVEAVVEHGADVGVAHDGDADRCLAVDAQGTVVDGDQIMAILALAMRERGELAHDTVVATVMSNLGFKLAMQRAGITVVETGRRGPLRAGGDARPRLHPRRRAERPRRPAGLRDHRRRHAHRAAPARPVADTGRPLAELASVMTRLPQVLVNVRDVDKRRVGTSPGLAAAVAAAEAELGEHRSGPAAPSGTEPLVRVMVEAAHGAQARTVADGLAEVVRREIPLVRRARFARGADAAALPLGPCAESWDTSDTAALSTSSSRACSAWSTAATTPPVSPSSPTARSRCARRPASSPTSRRCSAADPMRRLHDRHRPHPMGHPRRPDRPQRPPARVSQDGRVAVIHNGIIENFAELRDELDGRGRRA